MKNAFLALFALVLLPLHALSFKVDTLVQNGPINNRVNLVFLGDGYTQSELGKFITDAKNLSARLFQQAPFKEYAEYFNVVAISVPSNVSGAALNPSNLIDNYFGSTYGYAGIDRLLVPTKTNKVSSVLASHFPEYDQVFVVVNHAKYGGSGGWLATSSTNYAAAEVAIHEIGHSFVGLRDEYWAGGQYAREEANMTRTSNSKTVKWKDWVGTSQTGVYEYENPGQGWYRPHQACKMRFLGSPFCPVCRETITEKVLRLTKPIEGFSPSYDSTISVNDSAKFTLDLLKPNPNTLRTVWTIDGKPVARGGELLLRNEDVPLGPSELKATVFDTTSFSRKTNSTTYRLYSQSWNLNKDFSVSIEPSNAMSEIEIQVWPNPTVDRLNVSGLEPNFRYLIIDASGQQFSTGQGETSIDVSQLPSGLYWLHLQLEGQRITHPFVKQ